MLDRRPDRPPGRGGPARQARRSLILGWPDLAGDALRRRGDVEALVVDAGGEGAVVGPAAAGRAAASRSVVPEAGVGAAAAVAELVLVEAYVGGLPGCWPRPGRWPRPRSRPSSACPCGR